MGNSVLSRPDVQGRLAIRVHRASPTDAPGLAALFLEMQEHYDRPVTADAAGEAAALACRPVSAMFDPRVLLASSGGRVVGSMVLNVTFPAYELTRALYIRDLYVARAARRRGVGRMLVRRAAQLTAEEGFSALDWTTESANHGARHMYESCGARLLHRSYYRLTSEDLAEPLPP